MSSVITQSQGLVAWTLSCVFFPTFWMCWCFGVVMQMTWNTKKVKTENLGRHTLQIRAYSTSFIQVKGSTPCLFTQQGDSTWLYQLVLGSVRGKPSTSAWKWTGQWGPVTLYQCLNPHQSWTQQELCELLPTYPPCTLTCAAKQLFRSLAPCLSQYSITGVIYIYTHCWDFPLYTGTDSGLLLLDHNTRFILSHKHSITNQ